MPSDFSSGFKYAPTARADNSAIHKFMRHFDWVLFLDVMFLSCLGLLMVYSASLRFGHPEVFLGKQFLAFLIGCTLMFLLATINYQVFSQYPRGLFAFSLSLLVAVLLVGKTYHGTKAWFVIGPLSFQPTEICKLFVILIVAAWCDRHIKDVRRLKGLAIPFVIVLAHTGLILLQPDFGSTLVYYPIMLGILFVSGGNLLHLFAIFLNGLVLSTILLLHTLLSLQPFFLEAHPAWAFFYRGMSPGREFLIIQGALALVFLLAGWLSRQLRLRVPWFYFLGAFLLIASGWSASSVVAHTMKDYQRKRLMVFFNPGIDPSGSGYHVIQSVIALGSGKIFGKGLFGGTQSRLGFLPEQHTDFIFSVVGEELGFLTSGFVLLMYLLLLWRCIVIAGDSRDRFGSLVAVGIGSMYAFYAILNLSMVMGMAPVTGLPLPFLSYGGSSMISSLAAAGILLSIHARRYTY